MVDDRSDKSLVFEGVMRSEQYNVDELQEREANDVEREGVL